MKSSRKRFYRFGLGLVLVPASLWALVVALMPMGWARARVEQAMTRALGQPVRLGALRLSVLGGVRLLDLEVGPPADPDTTPDGPWLTAREVRLDLNLPQLVAGRVEPARCRASGVALRVLRRADGSFEFGDLLARDPSPDVDSESAGGDRPVALAIELADCRLEVLDAPTGTRLGLAGVSATGRWADETVELERLTGTLNGGRLELAARLVRGRGLPRFEGELRVEGAALDSGLGVVRYLAPALGEAGESVEGRLDLDVVLRGFGATGPEVAASLNGEGHLRVEDLTLDGCPLMSAIAEAFRQPTRGRVGSLRGDFLVADRRVVTRNLTAQVGPVPILMAGWTDFDGRLDYVVRLDHLAARINELADRLSPEARQPLAELRASLGQAAQLRLQGSGGDVVLSADGKRVDEWVERAANPNSREYRALQQLGQQIRDRSAVRRR
jgi:AsmA protein